MDLSLPGTPVTQGGVTVASISPTRSSGTAVGVRLTEPIDSRLASSATGMSMAELPLAYRASSLGTVDSTRANSPKIEIHTYGDDSDTGTVAPFIDFILSDVQSQDAEKIDVVETFGVPHIFTSGRFVRRTTFQGMCRTAGANYNSDTANYRVSQAAAMRVFYDRYLRATQQADNGQYTRIVVDDQYYTGWVTSFNEQRDASNEQWMPFTFTMIVLERSSAEDAKVLETLKRFVVNKKPSRFLATQAKAELSDAVGKCSVSWLRAGRLTSTLTLGDLTVKDGTDVKGAFSQNASIQITEGTPQRISVASDISGVVLVKDDGTELHGTDLEVQKPVSISLKVLDFASLWAVLSSKGKVDGTTAKTTVNFTVTPVNGNALTAQVGLTLDGVPTFTLTDIKVVPGAAPAAGVLLSGGSMGPTNASSTLALSDSPASTFLLPSNVASYLVSCSLRTGAVAAPPAVVSTATVSANRAFAQAMDRVGGAAQQAAEQEMSAGIEVSGISRDLGTGKLSFFLTVPLSSAADLRSSNPYDLATALKVHTSVSVYCAGYDHLMLAFDHLLDLSKPQQDGQLQWSGSYTLQSTPVGSSNVVSRGTSYSRTYECEVRYTGFPSAAIVSKLAAVGTVVIRPPGETSRSLRLDGRLVTANQLYGDDVTASYTAKLYLNGPNPYASVTITWVAGPSFVPGSSKDFVSLIPSKIDATFSFPPGV